MSTVESRPVAESGVLPALWWLIAGTLVGLGTAAILTLGLLLLIPGYAMVGVGVLWPRLRNQAAGMMLTGAATAPGLIAWLNREGPGEVCHTVGDTTGCSERWSPWPFLVVAVIMAVAGVVLATRRRR